MNVWSIKEYTPVLLRLPRDRGDLDQPAVRRELLGRELLRERGPHHLLRDEHGAEIDDEQRAPTTPATSGSLRRTTSALSVSGPGSPRCVLAAVVEAGEGTALATIISGEVRWQARR